MKVLFLTPPLKLFSHGIFALAFSFLTVGCANVSYIRSDVFARQNFVKNIYVMPVGVEVTLDPGFQLEAEQVDKKIHIALEKIRSTLKKELVIRGYLVETASKNFLELSSEKLDESTLRDAVLESMRPLSSNGISIQGKASKSGEKVYTLNNFDPQNFDSLVSKSLDCQKYMPGDIDTVLYLDVSSHVARRGFLMSLDEKSTLQLSMRMISFKEKEIVFSFERGYEKSDLFSMRKSEEAVEDILKNVPVQLR